MDFKTVFEAGEDGRPDWLARKSCNYMTAAVEECGSLLQHCATLEELNAMKDEQLNNILHTLQMSVKSWDSEKCPVVK